MTRDYTHLNVFDIGVAEGWAEAETDPTRINWPERQARAAIPFPVVNGRPVNPCEKTGITRGRNEMGFWGEQQMADALVTVTLNHTGIRYLLMIERGDGYGWAVPGGHVEPGETALQAAVRELAEETGYTDVRPSECAAMPPRYVPDPRASDEAWAVTVPVRISQGMRYVLPEVTGGDDARRAEWVAASDFGMLTAELAYRFHGRVFAAHQDMLRGFLGDRPVGGSPPAAPARPCPPWCTADHSRLTACSATAAACLATLLDVLAEATPEQHRELAAQVRAAAALVWGDR